MSTDTCGTCHASLRTSILNYEFIRPEMTAQFPGSKCACCGRRVLSDCGGWPTYRGPAMRLTYPYEAVDARFRHSQFFCDDCWVQALSLLAIPTLKAQVTT